jgi:Asp-tRNA(Asn)/Glu-tRNA(Gln) amidotransferase A subunit family amidase
VADDDRDLVLTSVGELAARIRRRELGATELTSACLRRIDALEPVLNAWVVVDHDRALHEAATIDERLARGEEVGPLAGIPLGVKDLEAARGLTTAYGSDLHADDPPAEADSVQVARLRAAGCVVLGKTTTPEHGWQGDTTSPHWGPTRNPWNTERSPGGSSGGSAAALAAGMVPLATGSDGGGSIRIPSALCGLSGLKPTHGRVPLGGDSPPGAGLLSVRGPMARRTRDLALALSVAIGPEPTDVFSSPADADTWPLGAVDVPARAGWCAAPDFPVDGEIAAVVGRAIDRVSDAGTAVVPIASLTDGPALVEWFTLWSAYRNRSQGHLRGTPDWERIDPGLRDQMDHAEHNVSAHDVLLAQDAIHRYNLDLERRFAEAPLLLCPTVAGQTAVVGHQGTVDGEETPFWTPFTPLLNMTRHPAGTVWVGNTADGMPVGLQVIGRRHEDATVLRAMAAFEDLFGLAPAPEL